MRGFYLNNDVDLRLILLGIFTNVPKRISFDHVSLAGRTSVRTILHLHILALQYFSYNHLNDLFLAQKECRGDWTDGYALFHRKINMKKREIVHTCSHACASQLYIVECDNWNHRLNMELL